MNTKYEEIFDLIDKAGGTKLPKVKELSFRQRNKIIFNIWSAIFGFLYYLLYVSWRKAITLSAISIVISILIDFILEAIGGPAIPGGVASIAIFGTRANIDLYKRYRLGDNDGWI